MSQVFRVRPRHLRKHDEFFGRIPGSGAVSLKHELYCMAESHGDVEKEDADR